VDNAQLRGGGNATSLRLNPRSHTSGDGSSPARTDVATDFTQKGDKKDKTIP
jgi:hypothetical protein